MKIYTLLFSVVILVACKKENPEPTTSKPSEKPTPCSQHNYNEVILESFEIENIESSEYLAAYPGSWWVYSDGKTVNCIENETTFRSCVETNNTACIKYYNQYTLNGSFMDYGSYGYYINGDCKYWVHTMDGDSTLKQFDLVKTNQIDVLDTYWEEIATTYIMQEHNHGSTPQTSLTTWSFSRNIDAYYDAYTLPNGEMYNNVVKIRRTIYVKPEDEEKYALDETYLCYAQGFGIIQQIDEPGGLSSEGSVSYLTSVYIAPH